MSHTSPCVTMPDGSRLQFDRRGGRVLALRPPDDERNFFWTSDTLRNGAEWNVGGDRTWISPEVDVFLPCFPDTSVFRVPPQLDPGAYQFIEDSRSVSMRCTLRLSRARREMEIELVKSWEPAANPVNAVDVRYAGYEQTTTLHGNGPLAIWNIVQVPFGGEAFIPVHDLAAPELYLGHIPPDDLMSLPGLVRYSARRTGLAKFGILPVSAIGRIGYLWRESGETNLVVRNIAVDPNGSYRDVVWSNPLLLQEQGCAIQICAVDNQLGAYVELEHHSPTGRPDVAQLWAYRGPASAIRAIANQLLGVSV